MGLPCFVYALTTVSPIHCLVLNISVFSSVYFLPPLCFPQEDGSPFFPPVSVSLHKRIISCLLATERVSISRIKSPCYNIYNIFIVVFLFQKPLFCDT